MLFKLFKLFKVQVVQCLKFRKIEYSKKPENLPDTVNLRLTTYDLKLLLKSPVASSSSSFPIASTFHRAVFLSPLSVFAWESFFWPE